MLLTENKIARDKHDLIKSTTSIYDIPELPGVYTIKHLRTGHAWTGTMMYVWYADNMRASIKEKAGDNEDGRYEFRIIYCKRNSTTDDLKKACKYAIKKLSTLQINGYNTYEEYETL